MCLKSLLRLNCSGCFHFCKFGVKKEQSVLKSIKGGCAQIIGEFIEDFKFRIMLKILKKKVEGYEIFKKDCDSMSLFFCTGLAIFNFLYVGMHFGTFYTVGIFLCNFLLKYYEHFYIRNIVRIFLLILQKL